MLCGPTVWSLKALRAAQAAQATTRAHCKELESRAASSAGSATHGTTRADSMASAVACASTQAVRTQVGPQCPDDLQGWVTVQLTRDTNYNPYSCTKVVHPVSAVSARITYQLRAVSN
eukprot:2169515-Prymnesium_polylepis.1